MNRILELQALLPSIDVAGQITVVTGSGTSLSCGGGNCNSASSNGCNGLGAQTAAETFF